MDNRTIQQLDLLTQRLDRLERYYWRWKALALLTLTLLGLMLVGATNHREAPVAQELRTRSLLLVDQRGVPVARLGLLPHGALGLGFYDNGKQSRILLSVEADGSSSISLFGRDGKGGVVLTASGSGATSLRLLDANWRNRVSLATWPNGAPFFQLSDRRGKDRILLGTSEIKITSTGDIVERSAPSLLFFDQDDTILWRAP